jgi:hypothetical protein
MEVLLDDKMGNNMAAAVDADSAFGKLRPHTGNHCGDDRIQLAANAAGQEPDGDAGRQSSVGAGFASIKRTRSGDEHYCFGPRALEKA